MGLQACVLCRLAALNLEGKLPCPEDNPPDDDHLYKIHAAVGRDLVPLNCLTDRDVKVLLAVEEMLSQQLNEQSHLLPPAVHQAYDASNVRGPPPFQPAFHYQIRSIGSKTLTGYDLQHKLTAADRIPISRRNLE